MPEQPIKLIEIASNLMRNATATDNRIDEEQAWLLSPLHEHSDPSEDGMKKISLPSSSNNSNKHKKEGATIKQSALNMAKCCMGTGTLALPYAASEGGLLFNIIGLAVISLWCVYSVDRLIKCSDLVAVKEENEDGEENNEDGHDSTAALSSSRPPLGISTMGKVAWHSFGPIGLHIVDGMMIILLIGVVTAYEDAAISFLQQSAFSTGSLYLDAVCTVILIAPLSCAPDVGFLSKYSAMGLLTIVASFVVIFVYGILENGLQGLFSITWDDLWPQSASECSHWFGIVVFSFGVVPVAYNIQESMAEPHQVNKATEMALWLVFTIYVIISNGVAIIYSPSSSIEYDSSTMIKRHYFGGDVIQHLPKGILPTIIRLAMTGVIIVTAPLLVIPCSELLEGRFFKHSSNTHPQTTELSFARIALRISICIICTCISVFIPDFVSVVSFIGCFSVALVSFVFPPLFYVVLLCSCSSTKRNKVLERVSMKQLNHQMESFSNTSTASEEWSSSCSSISSPEYLSGAITSSTTRSLQQDDRISSPSQYQNAVLDYSSCNCNTSYTASALYPNTFQASSGFQFHHLFDCGMILCGVFITIVTTSLTLRDIILSNGFA